MTGEGEGSLNSMSGRAQSVAASNDEEDPNGPRLRRQGTVTARAPSGSHRRGGKQNPPLVILQDRNEGAIHLVANWVQRKRDQYVVQDDTPSGNLNRPGYFSQYGAPKPAGVRSLKQFPNLWATRNLRNESREQVWPSRHRSCLVSRRNPGKTLREWFLQS